MKDKIKNRVAALKSDTSFKLNLSNNYLDDACTEALLSALSDETANMHHPAILDFKQIIVRVYLKRREFFCNSITERAQWKNWKTEIHFFCEK